MTQSHSSIPTVCRPTSRSSRRATWRSWRARAIREFPEYDYYWHLPGIRMGKRVQRNYNTLLGRYPGADGMKTGFICASGFNLVATATRDNKRLIAVVLGASVLGGARGQGGAILERGFQRTPLSWLTPSLGTVDTLQPVECGAAQPARRDVRRPPQAPGHRGRGRRRRGQSAPDSAYAVFLSSLRAPKAKGAALLQGRATGRAGRGLHRHQAAGTRAPRRPRRGEAGEARKPQDAAKPRRDHHAIARPAARSPPSQRHRAAKTADGPPPEQAGTAARRHPAEPRPRRPKTAPGATAQAAPTPTASRAAEDDHRPRQAQKTEALEEKQ